MLPYLCVSLNGNHNRRRPALSNSKHSIEDVTEKSETVADQIALAATHTETNQRRRSEAYSSDGEDYSHGNLEMNLIRPESEPVHTQITAKYTTNISTNNQLATVLGSVEDTETAEEYVAKAMEIYGTRLKDPIHIPSEEPEQIKMSRTNNHAGGNYDYYEQAKKQQHVRPQFEQHGKPHVKGVLEAEIPIHLNSQLQQVQLFPEKQTDYAQLAAVSQQPAPVYEKDPLTRSYELYDENAANKGLDTVDRNYHTKYVYQPQTFYRGSLSEQDMEEKTRVSASTEIPKTEIMKQIEKSVIKYMKELEAEGKIITAPQEPQPYFKVLSAPLEEKRMSLTTMRPKYKSSTATYNSAYGGTSSPTFGVSSESSSTATSHHIPNHTAKTRYSTDSESTPYKSHSLQQHHQEISESLAPNVEFIYKIKTRAPLQTATLKTISKPYSLPLKGNYDQFDHSAALKNIEEFDLSHVVTAQEAGDRPSSISSASATSGKPTKLYFNPKIYHDINSLPYKPEKSAAEYRKLKASDLKISDFKGYSGYFAEPATADDDKELTGSSGSEDGYPIMNPYQYILKKEPIPNKHEDSPTDWDKSRKQIFAALTAQKSLEYDSYSPKFNNNPEGYGYQHTYKSDRERDQQHKYISQRHVSVKRGKRGGVPHLNVNKKGVRSAAKDVEASLALRPPPKA